MFLLVANFLFLLFTPMLEKHFSSNHRTVKNILRVPLNNLLIALSMHAAIGVALLVLSRNRCGLIVSYVGKHAANSLHTGRHSLVIPSMKSIFHAGNYVGLYKDCRLFHTLCHTSLHLWKFQGQLWTKTNSVSWYKTQMYAPHVIHPQSLQLSPYIYQKLHVVYGHGANEDAFAETDDNHAQTLKSADNVNDVSHQNTSSMVYLKQSMHFAFLYKAMPSWTVDADFVESMEDHMTWVTLKYFEYSLTAGLFLIGILLLFEPHGDAYVYQAAFLGMFSCNIVAIPLHKILVHAASVGDYIDILCDNKNICMPEREGKHDVDKDKDKSDSQRHAAFSVIAFLIASWLFFVAAMLPYLHVMTITNSLEGLPLVIRVTTWMTVFLFFYFGIFGCIFITLALYNLQNGKQKLMTIFRSQNLAFELLNNTKWVLVMIATVGGLQTIGF
jgi:hypothetical protein